VGLAELSSALAIYFSAHITPLFEDVAARLTGEALLAVTAHFKSSPDEMKDSEDYAFLEKILRQPSRYGEAFQKGIASAAGVRFASFVRSPDERATRERKPEKADALSALVMSRLSTADADAKTIKAKLKEEEGIDISESYIYKELKKRFGGTRKLKLRDDD
jgi:hypothetical protein